MSVTPYPVAAFPNLPPGSIVRGSLYIDPSIAYLSGDVLEIELPDGSMIDVGWDEEGAESPFRIVAYAEYFGDHTADVMAMDVSGVVDIVERLANGRGGL